MRAASPSSPESGHSLAVEPGDRIFPAVEGPFDEAAGPGWNPVHSTPDPGVAHGLQDLRIGWRPGDLDLDRPFGTRCQLGDAREDSGVTGVAGQPAVAEGQHPVPDRRSVAADADRR